MSNFEKCLALVLVHEGGLAETLSAEASKREQRIYVPKNARSYSCSACDSPAYAKGFCNAHYIRARKGLPLTDPIKHRNANSTCSECDRLIGGKGGWGLCKPHYRKRRREAIKAYFVSKLGCVCQDCQQTFPLAVFDFHHLGDKDHSISDLIDAGSVESIELEMKKCILLCSNCHRIRHHGDE